MEPLRHEQSQQLTKIFDGHQSDIQLPEDELRVAFGLFNGSFIPKMRDIINLAKDKGEEFPRFYSWKTQLAPGLIINFVKSKNSDEADRVSITDGRFTNVLFQLTGDTITVEDSMIEEKITLNSPESLTQPIPSSRRSPAGNALGWVEKISEKLTDIKDNLEKSS